MDTALKGNVPWVLPLGAFSALCVLVKITMKKGSGAGFLFCWGNRGQNQEARKVPGIDPLNATYSTNSNQTNAV